ncbi:hypothetical protein M2D07_015780 [Pseudomonas sp. BGr12]|uniref:hypothetical protein n=1 Tax=Pseudomonas sp. BGr12 TaxID=2936269 RepID=UPI00255980BA|nr:hypothetical protein [Pseudomonas sp. BJa5]MDL2428479.1 hypothetical protein [Pseudomonas sp. BJa5]
MLSKTLPNKLEADCRTLGSIDHDTLLRDAIDHSWEHSGAQILADAVSRWAAQATEGLSNAAEQVTFRSKS